ncbi:MAG: DUF1684 domain-containing protein, partial [Bacteroidota bacterium]
MKFSLLLCTLLWTSSLGAQSTKAFKKTTCEYRKEYKNKFVKNGRAPFYQDKKGTKKMKFFKPNTKYLVSCTFERTPHEKPFEMPTYSGMLKPYIKYG